ncbi:MAG TPA: hypothetical protein GXZ65_05005 [Clostridiales bacterium]|jgi:di/tricarboxylate transporter|nr:hypothetical protein [Clostridiales bacterium]
MYSGWPPITLFLSALIISACGSDLSASIILSPMAFNLALEMGFNPFVALVGIWGGSMAVMMFPWTTTGGINLGTMMGSLTEAEAYAGTYFAGATGFVFLTIEFIVICLITKAFKPKNTSAMTQEKTATFNKVQSTTIKVILIVLVLIIIPSLIQLLAPNPVTKWISSNLSAQLLWTAGSLVLALLKCGNLKEIITKKVPWDPIILVVGMSLLFGLANPMGVVNTLGNILLSVPGWCVPPILAFICAFLSFFVSGAIIGPFFIPMAATLAATSGVSLSVILTCVVAGAGVSSVSPVSQGGLPL